MILAVGTAGVLPLTERVWKAVKAGVCCKGGISEDSTLRPVTGRRVFFNLIKN